MTTVILQALRMCFLYQNITLYTECVHHNSWHLEHSFNYRLA